MAVYDRIATLVATEGTQVHSLYLSLYLMMYILYIIAFGLCCWVRAMPVYDRVATLVAQVYQLSLYIQ